jgi:hypothetical protein
VPSTAIGLDYPSDGNGIISDGNIQADYPYRIRVENNITIGNGGSGIHAFQSDNIDIINNTSCNTSAGAKQNDGEIFANSTHDVHIYNNVLLARNGKRVNSNWSNERLKTGRNILYGTVPPDLIGIDDLVANPLLTGVCDAGQPLALMPKQMSPAIDGSSRADSAATDFFGREAVGTRDIGAVERP